MTHGDSARPAHESKAVQGPNPRGNENRDLTCVALKLFLAVTDGLVLIADWVSANNSNGHGSCQVKFAIMVQIGMGTVNVVMQS